MLSFTLLGSLLINALGLPNSILRNVGVVVLILVGLGLIFPKLEELLEKPFAFLPPTAGRPEQRRVRPGAGPGFALRPVRRPVLAAITVASATGNICWDTVALIISFTVGAALPLLLFALAGRRVSWSAATRKPSAASAAA